MYGRAIEATTELHPAAVRQEAGSGEANVAALKAGYHYGETAEVFAVDYKVAPAAMRARARTATSPATRRSRSAWSPRPQLAGKKLFLGCYPITPASRFLHSLAKYKHFGVTHVPGRGRDRRRSAPRSAPAYGGAIGVTTTSGPGIALKAEAIGLAVMTELPLVIVNVQRGGRRPACRPRPSSPTSARRCSAATASRRCRSSPRRARATASTARIEAVRIATHYMTPVILLSDGYLANGVRAVADAEPRRAARPAVDVRTEPTPQPKASRLPAYQRDERPSRARGSSPARPASSTASAASRRTRHRQHLVRAGEPRAA